MSYVVFFSEDALEAQCPVASEVASIMACSQLKMVASAALMWLCFGCNNDANMTGATSGLAATGAHATSDLEANKKSDNGFRKEVLQDGRVRLTLVAASKHIVTPVDIVFVLDTSSSMKEESAALEASLEGFLQQFSTAGAEIDYRVLIIADIFRFPMVGRNRVELLPLPVGSFDALEKIGQLMLGTIVPQPRNALRAESIKQIIVVSDDDARVVLADDLIKLALTLPMFKSKVSFSGIVGLKPGSVTPTCNIASVGSEYQKLANSPATKGLVLDLCSNDWSRLLKSLAEKIVVESMQRDYSLNDAISQSDPVIITVDGKRLPEAAFSVDLVASMITIQPDYLPQPGQSFVIEYRRKSK